MKAPKLIALCLVAGSLARADSIPADRLPASGWAGCVGVPGGIPTDYKMYVNVRKGGPDYQGPLAAGDGVADDSPALDYAFKHCPNRQFVYIPAGTYRLNHSLQRKGIDSGDGVQRPYSVVLRGDGPGRTKLLFYGKGDAIDFYEWSGIGNRISPIDSGSARGSTHIVISGSKFLLQPGIWMAVLRLNSASGMIANHSNGYMSSSCSQLVKVTAVDGDDVTVWPALNEGYDGDTATWATGSAFRSGVEDLSIENMTPSGGHNIFITGGQECWIKNVESVNASAWHFRLQSCAACEIRQCLVHDGWSAGGNADYGAGLYGISCNNLVEDNVFYHCRHAMPIEYGGQGNVFGYNYSFEPVNSDRGGGRDAELATDYLMGDVLTHGGNPRWNLWEGNVVATIRFDAVLGGSDFNTAFRNRVQRKGLPSTVVACFGSDIQWNNLNETLVGNVYEAPPDGHPTPLRRWGTNQDSDLLASVTGATNANPIVIAWEGSFPLATGSVVTITGVQGNTAANVANATVTVIDDTHFSLNGVDGTESDSYSEGGTIDGVDPRPQATALLDGEYDLTSHTVFWKAGSDHTLPDSLYLKAKPAWFGSLPWPAIDPNHPATDAAASNPAIRRTRAAK